MLDEVNQIDMGNECDDQRNCALYFSDKYYECEPEPSTSKSHHPPREYNPQPYKKQGGGDSAKQFDNGLAKTDQLIRNSERNKIRMYEVPGEFQHFDNRKNTILNSVDDDYSMVAAHVNLNTERKIAQGDYIDFAKLIPKDRISAESDHPMELVSRGGACHTLCQFLTEKHNRS